MTNSTEIGAQFARLKHLEEKALIAFVTAGDPNLEQLPNILSMLEEAGVDLIEIGLPYSDPIADGPVIQASSQRALESGVTPPAIFEAVSRCNVGVPVVAMGYYNMALRMGLNSFSSQTMESGISGVILSDLPPEESEDWTNACSENGLDPIFLIAPTSTDDRLKLACSISRGFVYAVSRTGVTGMHSSAPNEAGSLVRRAKTETNTPVCVGFGISQPAHVRSACETADGAVVGSWLVDLLNNEWQNGKGSDSIRHQVSALKHATRG